jgi:hypothetical protein
MPFLHSLGTATTSASATARTNLPLMRSSTFSVAANWASITD